MRSKTWLTAILMSLAVVFACARREQASAGVGAERAVSPAASVEKTYPLRGKVVSIDAARNQVTVAHEKIEGLWEPMTMAFEVRGGESGSLPAQGSTIRATLHVQDGRYWLTEVRSE